jgi:hypothetical protein
MGRFFHAREMATGHGPHAIEGMHLPGGGPIGHNKTALAGRQNPANFSSDPVWI